MVRGEATEELMKDPKAFTLLTQIAYRARRNDDFSVDNLNAGEALIGDYKSIGLTEQQYRTRKERLEKWGFVTFKPTNRGTVATIVDKRVYDINASLSNRPSNTQITNKQRTDNEQITTNKKVKKEKKEKKEKNIYMEFVSLSTDEYTKLVEKFGEAVTKDKIAALNDYIGSKGKKYKSHYHTILNWDRKNAETSKSSGRSFRDQKSAYGEKV